MKVFLSAAEKDLHDAWEKHCGDLDFVEVVGDIFACDAQCYVSPANSFGFMDGGIDWAYSRRFGFQVEQKLQRKLREEFDGELLVGQATMVETGDSKVPYLISAPTMRIPTVLAKRTVNPYLAARAALLIPSVECHHRPSLYSPVSRILSTAHARRLSKPALLFSDTLSNQKDDSDGGMGGGAAPPLPALDGFG